MTSWGPNTSRTRFWWTSGPSDARPRANALTYTKAMDPVRRLLAGTAAAREAGLTPGHFSFNVARGRCEACKGEGFEKVEMQFLSDVFVTCPECNGRRFKEEVLAVRYRGRSIHDILSMTVDEALEFFRSHAKITDALAPLATVGLGYLRLGQPVSTLSGGESQRLKLSRYLKSTGAERLLFIFDEPTTGLHFADTEVLLDALQRLTAAGHTVLVIEHNMDVVKAADWVVDLGPEGGEAGGTGGCGGDPGKKWPAPKPPTPGGIWGNIWPAGDASPKPPPGQRRRPVSLTRRATENASPYAAPGSTT